MEYLRDRFSVFAAVIMVSFIVSAVLVPEVAPVIALLSFVVLIIAIIAHLFK